jgi:hypothetical protein
LWRDGDIENLNRFGFNQPVVVDEANVILVGHGRWLAAQKLDLARIPVKRVRGLSEKQKRAYRILDNKLQDDSKWDFNNLELELGWLEDNDWQTTDWGLDELNKFFPDDEDDKSEQQPDDVGDEPFRSLRVTFASQQQLDQFAKLTGVKIEKDTKTVAFPSEFV